MQNYPDGDECAWMVAQFIFGKKLDKEEFVEICGGLKYLKEEQAFLPVPLFWVVVATSPYKM